MIVVDSNVIAALVLPTSNNSECAANLLMQDRDWAAPVLWRSEFTNILATGTRNRWFDMVQALDALATAEEVMDGGEFQVPAADVLRLAADHGCTGYDSEFVVLALDLDVKLVTLDQKILRTFPETAVSLEEFGTQNPA